MDSLTVEQSLFLRGGATFKGEVILIGAKVGGSLGRSGSTFEAALNMDSLTVERSLFLRGGATFKGEVILIGAKVGGQLDASGSTFEAALNMDRPHGRAEPVPARRSTFPRLGGHLG